MNRRIGISFVLGSALLVALGICGCGGGGPAADREDIAKTSDVEHYGKMIKAQIYEFRAKVRKRGPAVIKSELPLLLETFQGNESQPLGEHAPTYKEIADKLKAMESITSKDAAIKAVDQIGALADKLPGTANQNPVVD
jgi:hypothetical protein